MGKATDKLAETRENLKSIIKDCINIRCENYGDEAKLVDICGFKAEVVVDNMCFGTEETITEVQPFDYIELRDDGRLFVIGEVNEIECDKLSTDELASVADILETDCEYL